MSCNLILLPTEPNMGGTSVIEGIKYALEQRGYVVQIFNPLQNSTVDINRTKKYFMEDNKDELVELVIAAFEEVKDKSDFVLIPGINLKSEIADDLKWLINYATWFNNALIHALSAYAILITSHKGSTLARLNEQLKLTLNYFDLQKVLSANC